MKLTKYSHACLVVEKGGSAIVIDPGAWSGDLVIPDNVAGIIVTHEHADHCDAKLISDILAKNPDVVVYTHTDVIAHLPGLPTQAVSTGETHRAGDFTLEFVGGEHALIHSTIPRIANLGVIVDDLLYYPGDSFTLPGKIVPTIAIPASAPWMKIGEAMDFLTTVQAARFFPTHDAILSETGKTLVDTLLGNTAGNANAAYERIASGDSIEL
jgi:L-ascorbate metabolism protein UlaG (beta-lactamase superfamily)